MIGLIIISVILLVWGFAVGFEANEGSPVDVLLYWAYVMVGIAVACWVIIGLIKSAMDDPKSLVKIGIILAGTAVICLIAWVLAPGSPAVACNTPATPGELKLTDTILNLTYISGAAAIIAIIVGEVRMSIAGKK